MTVPLQDLLAKLTPDDRAVRSIADDRSFQVSVVTTIKPIAGVRAGTPFELAADGFSLFVHNDRDLPLPKPGDPVRLYGQGLGYVVRGVTSHESPPLRVYHYATPTEEIQRFYEDQQQRDEKKKQDWLAVLPGYKAWVAGLPPEFRQRIERFLRRDPEWGWTYGTYERFVCSEAIVIACALAADNIATFANASAEEQQRLVPSLKYHEHSGNTFGVACQLAAIYTSDAPERVIQSHGALCGLVGCQAYGCWVAYPEA